MFKLCRRIWHLVNRNRFERALVDEMRAHRDQLSEPSQFGDSHRLLEAARDEWGWNWLDDAVQDLRQGMRTLWRSPGYAITGTLILAFGIGLNLAFFQMASVRLIRPRAFKSPETLVGFVRHGQGFRSSGLPYAMAAAIAREKTALSAVLMQSGSEVIWDEDLEIDASFVSTNWFEELGYGAFLGRVFSHSLDDDDDGDGDPGVVLSYGFWERSLQRDPTVIGKLVTIDRRRAVVVGVASPDFPGIELEDTMVWIPIARREDFYPESDFLRTWADHNTQMFGRLRAGASMVDVRESLRGTLAALAIAHPANVGPNDWLEPISGRVNFMPPRERAQVMTVFGLLSALMLLVLAVAAANLGNLVLARSAGRVRELGIRIALGAKRSRIFRQLIIETLPLAVVGTLAGMVLASWAILVLTNVVGTPGYLRFGPDWRTFAASWALFVVALAVIGALPAWKIVRHNLTAAIKDGGQQVSSRLDRAFLRRFMMAVQVAGSCLLIAVAAMMTRTAQRALASDVGFNYQQVATLAASSSRVGLSADAARAYWAIVKERVTVHPEAAAVALVTARPLGGTTIKTIYNETPALEVLSQTIDPSYFSVMEIPIVRGRTFTDRDLPREAVIISQRLALAMYGGLDVVGQSFPRTKPSGGQCSPSCDEIASDKPGQRTIVGVAADAHTIEVTAINVAEMYAPLAPGDYDDATLIVRARSEPALLLPILKEAAAQSDPRVIAVAGLMRDDFVRSTRSSRLSSAIISGIGSLTLLLACLGIFGVVSYSVALRTKEIGVHLALGAPRGTVIGLMTRQALWPVLIGMTVGVASAFPVGTVLSGTPFHLSALDPAAYIVPVALLLSAGAFAAVLPALEVLRANPLGALRHD